MRRLKAFGVLIAAGALAAACSSGSSSSSSSSSSASGPSGVLTIDINAVWSVLSSVSLKGSDQVAMTFKTAAVPYFYYIADQVGIVDQKVWSKVSNPVTYTDKNPVGTGAFTTGSKTCTPQNIKYT